MPFVESLRASSDERGVRPENTEVINSFFAARSRVSTA